MRKVSLLTILISFLLSAAALAVTPCQLFVIERNKNANLVIYEARLDDAGAFASKDPVVAYWKLNATTGGTESLSMLDKRAYGFSIKKDGDHYRMALAPFKNRPILVLKEDKTVRAQMTINGINSWLSKVYVKAKEGTLLPKVEYLEIFGTAVEGGQKTYEKVVP
jgi:hypothetical protein